MPNQNRKQHKQSGAGGHPPVPRGSRHSRAEPMRTASWPGAPGKTQGDRSAGVKKLKNAHPKSEGV